MKEVEPGRRRRLSRMQRDLIEGESAIEMVATGVAVTVRLHGLRHAERIAPLLAAWAQQAQVGFRFERHEEGPPSMVLGPRRSSSEPR
jgi:hypothetical protein